MSRPQFEKTLLTIGEIDERHGGDNVCSDDFFEAQTGSAVGRSILSNICSM